MCCGSSTTNANTDTAPNDGFHSDDSSVSPDWANREGPHRYIGIIMVVVMALLAVSVWVTFAQWPKRQIRRWLGRGGKSCGEDGCDHESCGDEESQKKGLKDLKLKPSPPPGEASAGGAEAKRGRSRSRRREETKTEKLEVEQIEHSHSSTTTMANAVFDEKKFPPNESMETSHTFSTTPTTNTATPPLPSPAAPPPAHTLCRTRIRTPFVGSQIEQDSGRISRLSWHWLKRVGTPNSRS